MGTSAEQNLKVCRICGQQKQPGEFYAHPGGRGGRDTRCKECSKAVARQRREAKLEQVQEYDRARANRPDRVAARQAYAKTERGRERGGVAKKAWRERNPEKYRAQTAVNNALRDGKLVKPTACECGRPGRIHAHHHDYSKPLEVRWLCAACHADEHRKYEAAA